LARRLRLKQKTPPLQRRASSSAQRRGGHLARQQQQQQQQGQQRRASGVTRFSSMIDVHFLSWENTARRSISQLFYQNCAAFPKRQNVLVCVRPDM